MTCPTWRPYLYAVAGSETWTASPTPPTSTSWTPPRTESPTSCPSLNWEKLPQSILKSTGSVSNMHWKVLKENLFSVMTLKTTTRSVFCFSVPNLRILFSAVTLSAKIPSTAQPSSGTCRPSKTWTWWCCRGQTGTTAGGTGKDRWEMTKIAREMELLELSPIRVQNKVIYSFLQFFFSFSLKLS